MSRQRRQYATFTCFCSTIFWRMATACRALVRVVLHHAARVRTSRRSLCTQTAAMSLALRRCRSLRAQ